jgi:hypothetical protein
MSSEQILISARFQSSLKATIFKLQQNAAEEEKLLPMLYPDQRRREGLLIQKQLEKAFLLSEILAVTWIS